MIPHRVILEISGFCRLHRTYTCWTAATVVLSPNVFVYSLLICTEIQGLECGLLSLGLPKEEAALFHRNWWVNSAAYKHRNPPPLARLQSKMHLGPSNQKMAFQSCGKTCEEQNSAVFCTSNYFHPLLFPFHSLIISCLLSLQNAMYKEI